MLYYLTQFSDGGDIFNLFRYITFRAGGAFFSALIFGFIFGRPMINLLRDRQRNGQPIREDGPEWHIKAKSGTPTMGGVLIIGALVVSTLLWARLDNSNIWLVLFVTMSFGIVGFFDDYKKVTHSDSKGVSVKTKFLVSIAIACVAGYWAVQLHPESLSGMLAVPVFKDLLINLGF
ncbi:MAG: phospho-N-acetylmuramoyl-pentapeptide-transferase, partial [Albidovulum sp.]|nr:phospho-N-acetylmuramoyl-pentapeptide-transferase [Albidovulum sp.]